MTTRTPGLITASESESALHPVVLRDNGPERARLEADLIGAALPLPLPHRCAAAAVRPWRGGWFVAMVDQRGTCRSGFAVQVRPTPLLPGHRLLRVERFGSAATRAAQRAALAALVDLVRDDPRTLRLSVEIFSNDAAARATSADHLARLGFRRADEANGYTRTLALDLRRDEDAIFASFHRSARRNIREIAKLPLAIAPLLDPLLIPRMESLLHETLARTGARYTPQDWRGRMELSAAHPQLSRIVGVFRTDVSGPDALLAFAWGCCHGDHAQYADAASTRPVGLRIPLAYPLLWDLIRWGRQTGADWFDLGGVTPGRLDDPDDPLGGISDFKRFFSKDVVTVGDEWVLEPATLRATLAKAANGWLQGGLAASRTLRQRWRSTPGAESTSAAAPGA